MTTTLSEKLVAGEVQRARAKRTNRAKVGERDFPRRKRMERGRGDGEKKEEERRRRQTETEAETDSGVVESQR